MRCELAMAFLHDLGDIGYVCERLLMIDTGKIILDGRLSDIKKRFGNTRRPEVELSEEPPAASSTSRKYCRQDRFPSGRYR